MAQLVSSRFFLTRQNSYPTRVRKQKEQLECYLCLNFIKLLTAGYLLCSGLKQKKAPETTRGIHEPILRSEWNLRTSRKWAWDQESRPSPHLPGRRQQMGLFTVLDPENGSQSTKDVLFCFFLFLFFFFWNHFPFTVWGEQWLSELNKWLRNAKCSYTD